MKQEKIIFYLFSLLCVTVIVISSFGWYSLQLHKGNLTFLKNQQEFITGRMAQQNKDMQKVATQLAVTRENLNNLGNTLNSLQQVLDSSSKRESEMSSQINKINERVEKLRGVYDGMVSVVDDLKNQISVFDADSIAQVDLGEIRVEK